MDNLKPTSDPHTFILEEREGYVKYKNIIDGRIWEVHGICTGIGNCWKGAVDEKPILDCPVGPGFKDCCPLKIILLENGY